LEIAYYFINDYHPTIYINEIKKDENETNYYFKPTEEKLYTIRIIFTQLITDCSYMFYNCDKIISIDLSSFNSSKVNNMRYMFHGCTNLRYINFTNIITKNVYNMERIFYSCYKLNYLDLSNFDTRNVIYTDFMFYNAKNLEKIIFSENFKTINVINMDYMFYSCKNLEILDISSFNTENCLSFEDIFNKCNKLNVILNENQCQNILGYIPNYVKIQNITL
jgi:surface protein